MVVRNLTYIELMSVLFPSPVSPTTISVNSKPLFTDFLYTWWHQIWLALVWVVTGLVGYWVLQSPNVNHHAWKVSLIYITQPISTTSTLLKVGQGWDNYLIGQVGESHITVQLPRRFSHRLALKQKKTWCREDLNCWSLLSKCSTPQASVKRPLVWGRALVSSLCVPQPRCSCRCALACSAGTKRPEKCNFETEHQW